MPSEKSLNKIKLKGFAYKQGIYNQNHQIVEDLDEDEYGKIYVEAYKEGYLEASKRGWYFVSLDKDTGEIKSWYKELPNGNTWVSEKLEATNFITEESVKFFSQHWPCGRGAYTYTWA